MARPLFRPALPRLLALAATLAAGPLAAQIREPLAANDNRVAAGTLRDGVLTVRLELRAGVWHPEGETGEAIPVYGFGEPGKPLQAPAPLIRVPVGTTIALTLTSAIGVPATLYGLHERPGSATDVATLAPGATLTLRFRAGAPGTYVYYARTPDGAKGNGRGFDALLGGAFVVDAPGAPTDDRIFVLERWSGATRTAMNGKSWPFTERLEYETGTPVKWRIVNASDLSHPMHLHGLHFSVDGIGDGERYNAFTEDERPLVFTQTAEILETFEMTWTPETPGRWLFHCHRQPHMRLPVELAQSDVLVHDAHEHAHEDPAYAGMGGMIMGITVTGEGHEPPADAWTGARRLELTVERQGGDPRYYALSLSDPATDAPPVRPRGLTGPTIVLEQGKPVEIAVVNRMDEPTAIHWHGMELPSYFDGVPVIGGMGEMLAPPVAPGETFVARMIPPRAGTMIYHTHWHDDTQLTGGVHGALIVTPPGEGYDPATDRAFLFSQSPGAPFGAAMLLMNGVPQPNTLQLQTGVTYRFRFINITPSVANLRVSLRRDGEPVRWRAVARDAVALALAPAQATLRTAELQVSVGETYDFEYRASAPEQLTLEGIQPNDTRRAVQTIVFTDPPR